MSGRALSLVLLAGCAGELPPCEQDEFIAQQEDFADYLRWPRIRVAAPDPRLGTGARNVYVNARPPRGATEFPRCTMLVKVAENDPDPAKWLMVGMAKRGSDYNPDGATGWEWFDLDPGSTDAPILRWRGSEPPSGTGYDCALGEDEEGAEGVGDCNVCHSGAADNDYVLTPELQLR